MKTVSVPAVMVLAALAMATVPPSAAAQGSLRGLQGLTAETQGFDQPDPARRLVFPQDHAPHPGFALEWWYLTAVLTGEDGQDYGVQWTLFRVALRPGEAEDAGWSSPQVWMGHAGLTTPAAHYAAERFARGGIGQAGVTVPPFRAWIDDWEMRRPADAECPADPCPQDALDRLQVRAMLPEAGAGYTLELVADGPLVLHGADGFSLKSPGGEASHYYSQPFFRAEGTLVLPEGEIAVSGQAWLDREWSSQFLSEAQSGWDWFALFLDSGERVMGFQVRAVEGPPFTYASWISSDGTVTTAPPGALHMTPLSTALMPNGADVPVAWRLEWPERGLDAEIMAVNPESWMALSIAYWEGPVHLRGSHSGRGYLEMTGYISPEDR